MLQQNLQPIDKYITEVKNKAKSCNFGNLEASLVRDQIVIGVRDVKLKERLLREPDLDLAKTEKLCHAAEAVHRQIRNLNIGENKGQRMVVDNIRAMTENSRSSNNDLGSRNKATHNGRVAPAKSFSCRNCGGSHKPRRCPAYGTKCSSCYKYNHFAKCCVNRKVDAVQTIDEAAGDQSGNDNNDSLLATYDDSREFLIQTVETPAMERELKDTCVNWMVQVSANNCLLSLKVDTGAQINVISMADLISLVPRPRIIKRNVTLKSYQGQVIPSRGLCIINISVASGVVPALFAVVSESFQSVLGLATAMKLGIIDMPRQQQQNCDKFFRHSLQVGSVSKEYEGKADSVHQGSFSRDQDCLGKSVFGSDI